MRKVIYAWNYLEWGGAQVHFLALIKEAIKHFDVTVVLPNGYDEGFLEFLRELKVKIEQFDPPSDNDPANTFYEKIRRHYRKLRSEAALARCLLRVGLKGSTVHIDLLPHSSLLILSLIASRSNVFITSHNALPPAPAWREVLWRTKAGLISRFRTFHVFCSNEHARNYFSGHYSKRVADTIEVTYTSINPEEIDQAKALGFPRNEWLEDQGIPKDTMVILTVGNFIDRKGRWTLLDAARRIIKTDGDRNTYFLWLSPMPMSEEDSIRVGYYQLGDRFKLIDPATLGAGRINVLRFFQVADIFVLPSFVEGLPISLLEAMAFGIPPISTKVYGIPEAVEHENTGLLIEAGDDEALVNSIIRLSDDPQLRQRLGENARKIAVSKFDEREVARNVVRAYLKATSSDGE